MHFSLIKKTNEKHPDSCCQSYCSGWDLTKINKVCEHGLVCKTHPQPLFSIGGMKFLVVDHVLIKSSNTDAKPCIQTCSEKHDCRCWRTVTKWWGVDSQPRCYLVGNFKYIESTKGMVLQKQDLARCRSDLPGLCMLEGRHLLWARSISTGFLSAADQDVCPTLRDEEETEEGTEKNKSGSPLFFFTFY